MKKKLFFLFTLTTIGLYGGSLNSSQNSNARTRIAAPTRSSRAANTTPGRRANGFSQNPRLNWRHPYMNR